MLSWEMFQSNMENVKVKAFFQALELDVSQTREFFDMLDVDRTNAVGIDEFVEGCVRLRGGARSVDVNMVLLHCKKLNKQVTSLIKKTQQQQEMLDQMRRPSMC